MKADTRLFGEIDITEDKIITLENGMIGLPEYQTFALIFDETSEKKASVMWLQSMDDPQTAFPVMQPNLVKEDYNPTVNDEMLSALGTLTDENTYVLVTLTARPDITQTSVNLKAPIIINTDTKKGCQIIIDGDYPVKYRIYEAAQGKKKAEV